MNEVHLVEDGKAAPKRNPLLWAILGVALMGVAAVLYVILAASFKPHGPADLREFKKASLEKLDVPATPRGQPDTVFTDAWTERPRPWPTSRAAWWS
jgi:hypothetical protein